MIRLAKVLALLVHHCAICVLVLLYMCPRAGMYVCAACRRAALYMCPHTPIYLCPRTVIYVVSIEVLTAHTAVYVSSYFGTCVPILMYMYASLN